MSGYLLDTNFFIDAHRTSYPFDVFPSYWSIIKNLAANDQIWSIDKVADELNRNTDQLTAQISSEIPPSFFKSSSGILAEYAAIAQWANSRSGHYTRPALNTFLQAEEADAWLVAHGIQSSCTIVTHEISDPEMKRAIKIPEPCNHFGVRYIKPIDMLREIGVTI